jgi:hypothetical protein
MRKDEAQSIRGTPLTAVRMGAPSSLRTTAACTYEHFGKSSNCPRCQKQASDSDFMDLAVPGTAVNRQQAKQSMVQYLYGSPNAPAATVPLPQMASQLLNVVDHLKTATSVTLRQFSFEVGLQSSRANSHERTIGRIQSDFEKRTQDYEKRMQEKESQLLQMQQSTDAMYKELAGTFLAVVVPWGTGRRTVSTRSHLTLSHSCFVTSEAHKAESARQAQLRAGFGGQPQAQQYGQNSQGAFPFPVPAASPQPQAQQYGQNTQGAFPFPVPAASPGGSTGSAGSRSHHSGGKRGPSVPPAQEPPKKQAHAAVRGMSGVGLGIGVGIGAVGRPAHPLQYAQPAMGSMPGSSASRRVMPAMTPIQLPGGGAPHRAPQQPRADASSSQPTGTSFTGASGHVFLQGTAQPQRMQATSSAASSASSQSGHHRAQQPTFANTYASQGGWSGTGRPRSHVGSVAASSGSAGGSRPSATFPSNNARTGSSTTNFPAPYPRGRK